MKPPFAVLGLPNPDGLGMAGSIPAAVCRFQGRSSSRSVSETVKACLGSKRLAFKSSSGISSRKRLTLLYLVSPFIMRIRAEVMVSCSLARVMPT